MKRPWFCTWLLVVALAGACQPAAPSLPAATLASTTPAPAARAPILRVENPSDADVSDIPRLLATEALQAQGYRLEKAAFADTALSILAMDQGDLDVATITNETGWLAMQQGAKMVTVLDESNNTVLLLTSTEVQTCADLDGRLTGVSDLRGTKYTMLISYIKNRCPGAKPEYLIMKGSGNRLAALLVGELDATIADLGDWLELSSQQQANVHTLVFFAEEFPGLSTSSLFVRRALADDYPETVSDVIRATLEARRRVQDPQVLADEMVKRFELDPAAAASAAQYYLDRKLWDVNGYTLEKVQNNIDFLVEAGTLPAGLQATDVADLSYLEAVLDEIGRQ